MHDYLYACVNNVCMCMCVCLCIRMYKLCICGKCLFTTTYVYIYKHPHTVPLAYLKSRFKFSQCRFDVQLYACALYMHIDPSYKYTPEHSTHPHSRSFRKLMITQGLYVHMQAYIHAHIHTWTSHSSSSSSRKSIIMPRFLLSTRTRSFAFS